MIRQIVLKNFMSHRDTVIDLADGLTALTGSNNCGKSAIVAALDILCNGAHGAVYVIRHEAANAEVSVTTSEGDTFTWRRQKKNGKNTWSINGTDVGTGAKPPDDWRRQLKLQSVQVQSNPPECIDPHLSNQKKPIFLIDSGGAKIARFFASDGSVEELLLMQRTNKRRQSAREEDKKKFDAIQKNAHQEIDNLSDLPEIGIQMNQLDKAKGQIDGRLNQAQELSLLLNDLHDRHRKVDLARERRKALAELPPQLILAETQTLREYNEKIRNAGNQVNQARLMQASLQTLPEQPKLHDTNPLVECISKLNQVKEGCQNRKTGLDKIEDELTKALAELEKFVRMHPICPTCNHRLEFDNLIRREHAHE